MKSKRLLTLLGSICLIMVLAALLLPGCAREEAPVTPAPVTPAPAVEVYKWKFFTTQMQGIITGVYARKLIADIEEETGGRLQIEIFYPGEHPYGYGTIEVPLRDNECQLMETMDHTYATMEPGLDLQTLPCLFPNIGVARKAYARALEEVIHPILEENWNTLRVVESWFGPQVIHGYEAYTSLESMKGQRIRTWGGKPIAMGVEAMGAIPVSVAFAEVASALQTRLVDSAITSVQGSYDAGWYDVVKNTTQLPVFNLASSTGVNKDALAELPFDLQATFWHVLALHQRYAEPLNFDYNAAIADRAVREYGVTMHQPSPEFWQEVTESVRAKGIWESALEAAGPTGARVWKIFMEEIEAPADYGQS